MRRVPNLPTEVAGVIGYGSRYLTLFLIASLALNLVGVNIGWALALAILFLIIVVLTLRPLVENAAAGFVLKSRPSFAVGDEIQLSEHLGEVLSISARTTVLRTRDGRRVHVPNTDVLERVIVVLTAFDARRLSVDVTIDPECDLDAVTDVLMRAVAVLPMVKREPLPQVIVSGLSNGVVSLSVRFWFEPQGQPERAALDEVARTVHAALRDAGIELQAPRLEVDVGESGNDA